MEGLGLGVLAFWGFREFGFTPHPDFLLCFLKSTHHIMFGTQTRSSL